MKCIHCDVEIESDDNFCWKCGHWTAKGYSFLNKKENVKMILNGDAVKQDEKFSVLVSLLGIGFILFAVMLVLRGDNLFKPFIYLEKKFTNYKYGYNTSIIKTDNKYSNQDITTYEDAIEIIKKDFNQQLWLCENDIEITQIEYAIQDSFSIPSVSFCDAPYEQTLKFKEVISKMYSLFPDIQGALTNITITNASSASEYIAYFQPLYQFVNINEDIESFNKVNKTQILLNSYYFLNKKMLGEDIKSIVGDKWYVEDATWESTLAHELGHYISFVILLKENGIDNITFVTKNNYSKINNIIEIFNNGTHSIQIVNEALLNYNSKYNTNYDLTSFASTISEYAVSKDKNGNLIADETIAEAIHDYYLHKDNMKASSKEIVDIIIDRLYGV